MSDKSEEDFRKLIYRIGVPPEEVVMILNFLKSDILSVLKPGGYKIHIPYHVTWEHEVVEARSDHRIFRKAQQISEF